MPKSKKKKERRRRRKLQSQVITSPIKWLRVLKIESRHETPHPSAPFSSLGNYICLKQGNYAVIHDAYTLKSLWTSRAHDVIAFSADESLLGASNIVNKTVTIYHWPSMKTLATFTQHFPECLQYVPHVGYFGALFRNSINIFDTDAMEVRCLLQLESEIRLTNMLWLDDLCVLRSIYTVYFWHAGGGVGPVRVNIESADQPIDLVSDSDVQSIRTVRESRSAEQQLAEEEAEEAEEAEEEEVELEDDQEYEEVKRSPRPRQKPADPRFRLMDAKFMLFRGGTVVSSTRGQSESAGTSRLDVWDTSTGLLVERRFLDRCIEAASVCPDNQTLMLVVGTGRKNRWNVLQLRSIPSLDCIFQLPFTYQSSGNIQLSPGGDLMILGQYSMYWCAVETSEIVWSRRRLLWIARLKHSSSVWSTLPLPMFRKVLMFI